MRCHRTGSAIGILDRIATVILRTAILRDVQVVDEVISRSNWKYGHAIDSIHMHGLILLDALDRPYTGNFAKHVVIRKMSDTYMPMYRSPVILHPVCHINFNAGAFASIAPFQLLPWSISDLPISPTSLDPRSWLLVVGKLGCSKFHSVGSKLTVIQG